MALLVVLHGISFALSFYFASSQPWLVAITVSSILLISLKVLMRQKEQQHKLLQSLEHGLLSLRDNDFSVSLNDSQLQKQQRIITIFNQTSENLRDERQHIYQREMLLDKVLNASPMVTILVDHRGKIVFTNAAAQAAFAIEGSILGRDWPSLVDSLAPEFQTALRNNGESIFTLSDKKGLAQAWHVATSNVTIHHAKHQLFLLKAITEQLSKQEVATWKKVISVISHEINNSIAPISSMCHSGELLVKNLNEPRLNRVFGTISRRVNHLNEFIKGYATLTKIKLPNKTIIHWPSLIEQLQSMYAFELTSELTALENDVFGDISQLEQVLINILKNAHEADPSGQVSIAIEQNAQHTSLAICDNGSGMSPEVVQNALLPFYSTKHSGTGLGLALSREIIEAHGGQLSYHNRDEGGLRVSIVLPNTNYIK